MIGSNFPFGRELCISVEKMEKSEIAAIGGIYLIHCNCVICASLAVMMNILDLTRFLRFVNDGLEFTAIH